MPRQIMSDTPFSRFLGGSPGSVILKLIVISLIVGAGMVFFHLTPRDLLDSVRRLIETVLGSGLDGVRTILVYIAYGAMVVVPVFVVVRLLKMGRRP
jgi:hypothetical protein